MGDLAFYLISTIIITFAIKVVKMNFAAERINTKNNLV